MPPIPKFAQVLAQRAKAKPKVISGSPKLKKFAKDDMELAKIRRGSIKKSLEKEFPKKSKDDSELMSIVSVLKRKNIKRVNEREALSYIKEYQTFLRLFKSDSGISLVNELEKVLCRVQASKKFDIKEINSLVNKIIKKYKEVNI